MLDCKLSLSDGTGDSKLFAKGCHSRPCLHPDCFLLTVRCSSKCMGMVMCLSGRFAKGLVSGAVVLIRPL